MKIDANEILQQRGGSDELFEQISIAGSLAAATADFHPSTAFDDRNIVGGSKQANLGVLGDSTAVFNSFQSAASYFRNDFQNDSERLKKYSERKTGFENIDKYQIFVPGLYTLGGLPGTGKTAFAMQMAAQLTAAGEHCLYLSYEVDAASLRARFLSQELRRRNPNSTLTALDIRFGGYTATLGEIIAEQKQLEDFRISCTGATLEALIQALEMYVDSLDAPPVIFIDYLQRVPLLARVDRFEGASRISYTLKEFSNKTDATIIAISSINRDNYSSPGAEESFKLSGDIEYSGDALWILQLYAVNAAAKGSTESRKMIQRAKKHSPREMELICVKNRNGTPYNVYFNYFSRYDFFEPYLEVPKEEWHFGDNFDPKKDSDDDDVEDEVPALEEEDSGSSYDDEEVSLPI